MWRIHSSKCHPEFWINKVTGLPVKNSEGETYTYRARELSAEFNWVDTEDEAIAAAIADIANTCGRETDRRRVAGDAPRRERARMFPRPDRRGAPPDRPRPGNNRSEICRRHVQPPNGDRGRRPFLVAPARTTHRELSAQQWPGITNSNMLRPFDCK